MEQGYTSTWRTYVREKFFRLLKLLASTLVIPPIADVWEECLAGGSDYL